MGGSCWNEDMNSWPIAKSVVGRSELDLEIPCFAIETRNG